ncbi:MAG: allantoinase AllB [Chloroflexaceae bacterium]|jgi:allantoinase|nr:allantoinase AllB [Chloroflexaceae bacterium]
MTRYDLLIRNGTLVTPQGLVQADLASADEQIVAVEPALSGSAAEELDASGLHIFPGLIDAHVHFNEPGRSHWEGWASGSRALAAGGGTCCFEMPLNASPPTLNRASFAAKLAAAQAVAVTDFGLWGGLTPGNLAELDELAACGVIGFKAFMSNSGIEDFQHVDDMALYDGMARAARLNRLVAVHAENDTLTGALARRALAEGRHSVRDFLQSRPVVAELEAIQRAILFAEETGCRLHIVHVSCGRGVVLVAEAAARGMNVSCETCPNYLVLTEDDVERLGALAKCAPPLRPQAQVESLWELLAAGTLPMVASDHSPAPPEMKGLGGQSANADFFSLWGGISGCQSTLELLLTEGHHQRGLPLSRIAAATAGYVAGRFEIGRRPETGNLLFTDRRSETGDGGNAAVNESGSVPGQSGSGLPSPVSGRLGSGLPSSVSGQLARGHLAVGYAADLALVDLDARHTLTADDLFYRHRISPYVGRALHGRVVRTILRGRSIFANGQILVEGGGRLVTPM